MSDQDFDLKVKSLFDEIQSKKSELLNLLKSNPITVLDYNLLSVDHQKTSLSSLFGDKSELILVHNMGKSCKYCTLWADGFSSLSDHLQNRAAFALVSPDEPSVLKEFSTSRNWNFPVYSAFESTFTQDMGYAYQKNERLYYMPGVSIFTKNQNIITRTARDFFGPGDFYNVVWHLFDLLPHGSDNWEPSLHYQH